MTAERPEKEEKNKEKIFKKNANPQSARALPFYIIDMLHPATACGAWFTIPQMQRKILEQKKAWYDYKTIQRCLNTLHDFSATYMLRSSKQTDRHGTSIGVGFMLILKTQEAKC